MSAKRRRSQPKPVPFIMTGAIIGFLIFSVVSWLGPNRNEGFDINYDPGAALGYMSVMGLCLGALVGAAVAALFTYRK
ncbi:hypothetical protein [Janibacter sp. GS2]|uniref:hypothetical protein n=1 Tax=Janibacter sp. GS2 TaxID=3442646 RepID=UPI003EBA493F